jgi:ATP-dependent Clp protease protease subunit
MGATFTARSAHGARARQEISMKGEENAEQTPELLAGAKLIERLFEARSILIHGEINSQVARMVTAQLLALASHSDDDIRIYIHSEGGHVESGDTIHDMIRFVKPRVRMIGTGWVASAGVLIYLAAPRQDRFCLPNTRFLLHQPTGGVFGQATDIGIEAEEIVKMRERLNRITARETGQSLERVEQDSERNFWMSPEEALEYGLVGSVISTMDEL